MSAKDQIKQIVDYFKREPQLKDKTDGMAEGLLLGANLADDANELSKETDASLKTLQREYTENGNGSQTTAEITVARDGELVLDDRLKRDFGNVNAQLEQTGEKINSQYVNIKYPPIPFSPAIGDGVTDDTNSLNLLIKYAAENKRKLYIPAGIYLNTGLKVLKNIEMEGANKLNSIFLYDGTGTAFKVGDDTLDNFDNSQTVFYSKFQNFSIQCVQKAALGLEVTRLSHSTLEHIQIHGFSLGVSIHGYLNDPSPYRAVYNNRYKNIETIRCDTGFETRGVISDSYFDECHVEYPTINGFVFRNSNNQVSWNVSFEKCTVVGAVGVGVKKAVFIDNAVFRNLIINGNNFENFTEHGIYQKAESQANAIYSLKTEDNGFFPLGTGTPSVAGIELNNSYNHDLDGNSFFGDNVEVDIRLGVNALSGILHNNVGINKQIELDVASDTNIITAYKYHEKAKQRTQSTNIGFSAETGDVIVNEISRGFVVPAPNGALWRIRVTDTGEFFSSLV